jgi:glycosyltransferase involved in cell wall biosynthesis
LWTLLSYLRLLIEVRFRLRRIAPDVVHAQYTVTHGVIAASSGRHPLVVSAWGSDVIGVGTGLRGKLLRALNRYTKRRADLLCSTSQFMRDRMLEILGHASRIIIIPFGVDAQKFSPLLLPRASAQTTEFRIGFVKALKTMYGPDILLRAMALVIDSVPNARLVMFGRGPLEQELRRLAREFRIDSCVEFAGYIEHDSIPEIMRTLDVLVNPTVVEESFGVVILEASACGIPVVVTRVGGVGEVCLDNETGLLVEANNSHALASAIIRLAQDPELRNRLGMAGRKFVCERYVWDQNVEQMLMLQSRLVMLHSACDHQFDFSKKKN